MNGAKDDNDNQDGTHKPVSEFYLLFTFNFQSFFLYISKPTLQRLRSKLRIFAFCTLECTKRSQSVYLVLINGFFIKFPQFLSSPTMRDLFN